MKGTYQSVLVLGNLAADPDVRSTNRGLKVANFTLATTEKNDEVQWHRCSAFDKTAAFLEQYAHKGDKLLIQGRLRTRKYTGKDGMERSSTEITCYQVESIRNPKPAEEKPILEETGLDDENVLMNDDDPFGLN
tara:strand:+ start:117 stop:518 length:402 start_codon:yes stop_codon:yes gene_type:complete